MNIGSLSVEKTSGFANVKVNQEQALAGGVTTTDTNDNNGALKSAVEVMLDGTVKALLREVSQAIQQRQVLLDLLPEPLEQAVRTIIRQNTSGQETLASGLVDVVKTEKALAGQIQQLAEEILLHLDRQQLQSMIGTLPESMRKNLRDFLLKENAYSEKGTVNSGTLQSQEAVPKTGAQETASTTNFTRQNKNYSGTLPPSVEEDSLSRTLQQLRNIMDTLPETAKRNLQDFFMKENAYFEKPSVNTGALPNEIPKTVVREEAAGTDTEQNSLARQDKAVEGKVQQLLQEAVLPYKWQQLQYIVSKLPEHMRKSIQEFLKEKNGDTEEVKNFEDLLQSTKTVLDNGRKNPPAPETIAGKPRNQDMAMEGRMQQLTEETDIPQNRQQTQPIIDKLPESIKKDLQAFLLKESAFPENLKTVAESLQEIAKTYQKPTAQNAELHGQETVLALTVPLYLGEGTSPYPAYIHVYRQQDDEQAEGVGSGQDIWLRICLSTENIGIVDMIFHLYKQSLVNIGVTFSGEEPAKFFETFVPLVRQDLKGSAVTLAEIRVKATGVENEKRK